MPDTPKEDKSPENLALQARPWLVRLAEDYKRGADDARLVAVLPDLVMTIGVDRENAAALGVIRDLLGMKDVASGIHGLNKDNPKVRAEKERIAKERMADLEKHPQIHAWLLWIRHAALVRAWASLEAFAEDAWTESLNRAGRSVRQGAFASVAKARDLNESSNLSGMQISVGFLAKYDFNLQDKIGTVLAEKFSFKTVDGITAAYKAAFGWKAGTVAPAFPDPTALRAVEWKRHAIVHRGGTIDDEYASKAGLDTSLLGTSLEVDTNAVVDDINTVVVQGAHLLGRLALWLETVEPAASQPPAQ